MCFVQLHLPYPIMYGFFWDNIRFRCVLICHRSMSSMRSPPSAPRKETISVINIRASFF